MRADIIIAKRILSFLFSLAIILSLISPTYADFPKEDDIITETLSEEEMVLQPIEFDDLKDSSSNIEKSESDIESDIELESKSAKDKQETYCGLESHIHSPECYSPDGELICELPEHTHSDICFIPSEEELQDIRPKVKNDSSTPITSGEETKLLLLDSSDITESEESILASKELTVANVMVSSPSEYPYISSDNLYLSQMNSSDIANIPFSNVKNYTDVNGNVAYSYNLNQSSPDGRSFSLLYQSESATDRNYWDLTTNPHDGGGWYTWSNRYYYLRNTVYLTVYYGYPYNLSNTDMLKRAVDFYGISPSFAQDALRLATQLAIWYATDTAHSPIVYGSFSSYDRSYGDPVFYLAGELAKMAYDASGSRPDIALDIYQSSDSEKVNVLTARTPALSPSYVVIQTEVTLSGKDIVSGEFSFNLQDADGNVLSRAVNDEEGNVAFEPIPFYTATSRTYYITQNGDNDWITYDTSKHSVEITIFGRNYLTSSVQYDDGLQIPVFSNIYTPPPSVDVTIRAYKTFDGAAPGDKRFTFILRDAARNEIQRVTNDDDGVISFAPITYYAAGTYTYTIEEQNDMQPDIDYDSRVYQVTVTVTQIVSELDGKITFGNHMAAGYQSDYFYMEDQDTGKQYVVYCLNNQKAAPDGRYYSATQDVSDDTMAAAIRGDAEPGAPNRVRRILYYFELHPDKYTPYQRQLILWSTLGTSSYVDQSIISEILSEVQEVPSNFHTVFFDPGESGYQSLIMGYMSPEPETVFSVDDAITEPTFENKTPVPHGAILPETGGLGTFFYTINGILLIFVSLIIISLNNTKLKGKQ